MADEAPLSPLPDSVASDLSPLSIGGLSEDGPDEQVVRLQRKMTALHQNNRRHVRQLELCLNRVIALDGRQRGMGGSSNRAMLLDSDDAFSMSSMSFRGGTLSSRGSTADEAQRWSSSGLEDFVRQRSPRASTSQPEEEDDAEREEEHVSQKEAEKLLLEPKQAKEATLGESGSDAPQGDDPEPEPHRKDSPRDDADAPVVVAPPCGTPGGTPCDKDQKPSAGTPLPPKRLNLVPTPQQQRRHPPQKQTPTALQRRRREPDTGSTPTGRSSSGSDLSSNGEPSQSRDEEVSLHDHSIETSTSSELDTSAASVTVPLECGSKSEGAHTHDAADTWDPEDVENNAWRIWRTAGALSTPEEQARYLQNFPALFKQWQEGFVQHAHVPRPGEESLHRRDTVLGRLEQNEMAQTITITVPEGMGEERRVSFNWENKQMEVVVPADYDVGSQLPIIVPKKPPLEKNRTVAQVRDHAHLPDYVSVWSVVRHPPQKSSNSFGCDEIRGRLQQYKQLGGKNMTPLLPFTPEQEEF
jgi:hypothetical protein